MSYKSLLIILIIFKANLQINCADVKGVKEVKSNLKELKAKFEKIINKPESAYKSLKAALDDAKFKANVTIDYILSNVNENIPALKGNTILIMAASRGLNDLVQLLLENGADPNITYRADKKRAIDLAKENKFNSTVDLINKFKAKPSLPQVQSLSPQNLISQLNKIIIQGDIKALKKLLVTESKNISPVVLENALKFAKDQLDKENKEANIKKFEEIVMLLESEPIRHHLRSYFPEDVVGIIEGYASNSAELKEIEEQIKTRLMKQYVVEFGSRASDEKNKKEVQEVQKNFYKLNTLNLVKKIKVLKFLAAMLKLNDTDNYLLGTIAGQYKEIENVRKDSSQVLKEIIGFYPSDSKNFNPKQKEFEKENYFGTFPFQGYENAFIYLFYKYIYLLLDEKTIQENGIESPEQLKNSLFSLNYKNELKDL